MQSKASVYGHPIHPLLVPFPVAFLIGCFVSDLIFWGSGNPFWPQASVYLALGGLIMGALAAVAGLVDFIGLRDVRERAIAWVHFLGNATVLVLALVRVLYSWSDPAGTVLPWGLVLSLIFSLLLLVTGWIGGELAYRYHIGVIEKRE